MQPSTFLAMITINSVSPKLEPTLTTLLQAEVMTEGTLNVSGKTNV